MTELDRAAVIRELDAIMKRAASHINSKGDISAAVAVARSEMAQTLKTDIEMGTYDRPGSSAQGYFLETLRARWFVLTPRQRKRLWKLDSLLQISIRHLADPKPIHEGEPTEPITQTLDTPKPRRSPWFWPVISLSAFIAIIVGGTVVSLLMGGA